LSFITNFMLFTDQSSEALETRIEMPYWRVSHLLGIFYIFLQGFLESRFSCVTSESQSFGCIAFIIFYLHVNTEMSEMVAFVALHIAVVPPFRGASTSIILSSSPTSSGVNGMRPFAFFLKSFELNILVTFSCCSTYLSCMSYVLFHCVWHWSACVYCQLFNQRPM